MRLNIKNEKTDRLARELAALTGQSITAVVTEALREKLDSLKSKGASPRNHNVRKGSADRPSRNR